MPVTSKLYSRIREDEDAVIVVTPFNHSSPSLCNTGSFTVSSFSNTSELQLSLYENIYVTVSGVTDIRAVILVLRNYCLPHLRSLNFILTSLVTTTLVLFTDLYVYNSYPLLSKITFMIKKENASSPKEMTLATENVTKVETRFRVGTISVFVSKQHIDTALGEQSATLSFTVKTKNILANIPQTHNRIVYNGQVFTLQLLQHYGIRKIKEQIRNVRYISLFSIIDAG